MSNIDEGYGAVVCHKDEGCQCSFSLAQLGVHCSVRVRRIRPGETIAGIVLGPLKFDSFQLGIQLKVEFAVSPDTMTCSSFGLYRSTSYDGFLRK